MIDRRQFLIILPVLAVPANAESRRSSSIVTAQALPFINTLRKKAARDPLIIDPVMEKVALEWSKEMALLGQLSHKNFKSRMRKAGIVKPSAENIAVGQSNVKQAIQSWEQSSNHRRNIVGIYNRVGMAVAKNANSENRPYWTMILSV